MNPKDDWMFNQVGDDRDHRGCAYQKKTRIFMVRVWNGQFILHGNHKDYTNIKIAQPALLQPRENLQRIYFGRFNAQINTTSYADNLKQKAALAYQLGQQKPGVAKRPRASPYFYEEDNWMDDMELAASLLSRSSPKKA